MKNLINRKYQSVLATFALAAILVPMSFVNAATFNGDQADYQTLLVSNYTLNPGSSSNWSSSVSAVAGQIVSFQIYYHNSSNQTANNTKISLNLPSGQFTNSSVSATISADSTQSVQGSASINLSSSQTLTLIPGSLQWYPNQSDSTQSLPSGQSGDQIVSSGINIGNIAPGWESQGYVVVRAQVSTTQAPQGQAPTVSTNQPTVTTVSASPIYQNSALVNGSVNPNGGYTTAWFQWGTNNNLGNTTISQSVGSGTNFTNSVAALTGLSANTTYYYRAVASNNSGTVYGSILSFNTQAANPIVYQSTQPQVIYQPTQPQVVYQSVQPQVIYVPTAIKTATSSLVLLISGSDQETAIAGNELHYVVVYKNISQQKLTNVILKIIFPLEVSYISSNPKEISLEGNSITYQVGNLDPNEEGIMDVDFMVKNSVRNNDSLIFSATLEYQDAKNAFHSDNTFLSVLASNRPSLMANLLSIGGFSGIFWGLILGLIIGFMIYWLGFRKRFVKAY